MRVLVVGAGAVGGYFGGRLLAAKRDVTFLVRPHRAAQLASAGLRIRSLAGAIDLPAPPTVVAEHLAGPFDVVLLSCKAYDLDGAIASFAPAVGENTAIVPLLNGMRHVDVLSERFGAARVLGGQCFISAVVDPDGVIKHMNDMHSLTFGELDGSRSARVLEIASTLSGAGFESRLSEQILGEMWEKWVFIAAGAAMTSLMRAAVGVIVTAGGTDLMATIIEECAEIARHEGFPMSAPALERTCATLNEPASSLTSSMLRDIEHGTPIEADHIIGDLLRRGGAPAPGSLLRVALVHLKAYEARRSSDTAKS
ncbi:MAG: 2-dehydropantoate 2-reductase [Polyangiaceae bacterium]